MDRTQLAQASPPSLQRTPQANKHWSFPCAQQQPESLHRDASRPCCPTMLCPAAAGEALLALDDVPSATAVLRQALVEPQPTATPDVSPQAPLEGHPTASSVAGPPYLFGGGDSVPPVSPDPITAGEAQGLLLIDSFLFNGEIAAEVRLNATAHLFDSVIVVEAWQPHSLSRPRKTRLFAHTAYWRGVFGRFGSKVKVVEVGELGLSVLRLLFGGSPVAVPHGTIA